MDDQSSRSAEVDLIAFNKSLESKYALNWYINNLSRPNKMLILFHVIELPELPFYTPNEFEKIMDEYRVIIQDNMNKSQQLISQVEQTCQKNGISYKTITNNVTSIVVSKCNPKSTETYSTGFVLNYVLRHATVPVHIVPYPNDTYE
ncbi:hypothetical protein RF11_06860 [Thelohanellus kitauei]|uniref:UspA domain-containing protein n=1 Tax=Thelohanellus kitauei TaxID=669202 RepID=A0A0C2MF58_THEKT|nr:hypothetical protein RF11_06860 [Thelohanellus kitauei]